MKAFTAPLAEGSIDVSGAMSEGERRPASWEGGALARLAGELLPRIARPQR